MRTLARSAVLITWVAVMIALVVRSGAVREPLTPSRPLPAEASEQWHGIYGEGKKIGYSHRVRDGARNPCARGTETLMGEATGYRLRERNREVFARSQKPEAPLQFAPSEEVTRSTSSTVVRPSRAFCNPPSRSVVIPAAIARLRSSSVVACAMTRLRISSVIGRSS